MTTIEIPLPWTRPPLRANDRRTWQAQHRARAAAMEEARWAIRAAAPRKVVGAEITLHYRVPDRRRRDTDGPEPTKKVTIDALVLEGVLPDDSWVEVPRSSVVIHPPTPDGPAMWLELDVITEYHDASPWCQDNKHERCRTDDCPCTCHIRDEEP